MSKNKSTKRALLLSALSLLLCVSMLVGSTFAWFTDSVTSGKNQIVAGNLDVELDYKKVVDGVATEWDTVKDKTDIFDPNALWEPGHVEVVYLRVTNKGSLALKYQLGVNFKDITIGKTEDGKDIKLSDHLVFATVASETETIYANRDEVVKAAADTAKGLKDYNGKTTALEVGGVDYLTLIVYMPETVGNEANYRGTDVPTIELGINLYATQYTAEDDSFDEFYDENAWVKGFKVYNANELQAAINAGETNITLMDNIEATETVEIPAGANVALNLNGKTITGTTGVDADGNRVHVLTNYGTLNVVGGTISSTGENGGSAIYNEGTLAVVDTELVGAPFGATGNPSYAVNNIGTATLTDVTITADHGCLCSYNNGVATLNNVTATMGLDGKTHHALYTYGGGSIIVNGGTYTNKATNQSTTGASVINGKVIVNSGTFNGRIEAYFDTPEFKGGTFSVNPSSYVATGYVVVNNTDGTYTVAEGDTAVTTSDELVSAINAAADGDTIVMAAGDYALRFTNDITFNVDNLNLVGLDGAKLSVSSSEVHYGRIQGDNVTFENIIFTTDTIGATGKATYNDCTFAGTLECASSNSAETYANNCTMKQVHTSGDMTAGNAYFTGCTIEKAEYGKKNDITLTFTDCTIGELISWNVNTTLNNCKVTTLDKSHMTTAILTIDGAVQKSASTQDALNSAVGAGEKVEVELATGSYNMPGTSGDVTISGTTDTNVDLGKTGVNNVTFNGITVNSTGYYGGLINNDTVIFNDCVIDGTIYLYGEKVVFNNCTFDLEDTNDYIWVYATKNAEFNNCTFNTMGKAILIFQDGSTVDQTVKVEGCTFNATQAGYNYDRTIHISAVSMDGTQGGTYNVILNNNTVDEDFNGLWQDKTNAGNITVTVDGTTVLTPNT